MCLSPELEVLRPTLDIVAVPEALVLLDAQVTALDQLEPVLRTLTWSDTAQVQRVKDGETDLSHEAGRSLVRLKIRADENNFALRVEGGGSIDVENELVGGPLLAGVHWTRELATDSRQAATWMTYLRRSRQRAPSHADPGSAGHAW